MYFVSVFVECNYYTYNFTPSWDSALYTTEVLETKRLCERI